MDLGNWILSSPNSKVKFWSNDTGEVLVQYEDEILAEFKLSSEPSKAINVISHGCKLAFNKAGNSITIIPIVKPNK